MVLIDSGEPEFAYTTREHHPQGPWRRRRMWGGACCSCCQLKAGINTPPVGGVPMAAGYDAPSATTVAIKVVDNGGERGPRQQAQAKCAVV